MIHCAYVGSCSLKLFAYVLTDIYEIWQLLDCMSIGVAKLGFKPINGYLIDKG